MYIQLNLDDIHHHTVHRLSFSYCCYCHRCRCCLSWFDWKSSGEIYIYDVEVVVLTSLCLLRQYKKSQILNKPREKQKRLVQYINGWNYPFVWFVWYRVTLFGRSCRPSWKGIALLGKPFFRVALRIFFILKNGYGSGLRCVRPSAVPRSPPTPVFASPKLSWWLTDRPYTSKQCSVLLLKQASLAIMLHY